MVKAHQYYKTDYDWLPRRKCSVCRFIIVMNDNNKVVKMALASLGDISAFKYWSLHPSAEGLVNIQKRFYCSSVGAGQCDDTEGCLWPSLDLGLGFLHIPVFSPTHPLSRIHFFQFLDTSSWCPYLCGYPNTSTRSVGKKVILSFELASLII